MPNSNCLDNIQCPKCGQDKRFKIAAQILVTVTDNGVEDIGGDFDWDKDSFAQCPECGYNEKLSGFHINEGE